MGLRKLLENLNIIQALPDKPTNTATELKQQFDLSGNKIKTYINEILTEDLDLALSSKANSSDVYTKTETDILLGVKANTSDVNNSLTGKAPNNHASSSTTYGVATSSNYGHCKIVQSTDINTINEGEALGAYQGYYLKTLIAQQNHDIIQQRREIESLESTIVQLEIRVRYLENKVG